MDVHLEIPAELAQQLASGEVASPRNAGLGRSPVRRRLAAAASQPDGGHSEKVKDNLYVLRVEWITRSLFLVSL